MSKAKLFIETVPRPVPLKLHKRTLERRSERIWKFLEKRDLITIKRLAEKAEWDESNFWVYMKKRKRLPQKVLLKVEEALEPYGL